jgi:hypothetical protein
MSLRQVAILGILASAVVLVLCVLLFLIRSIASDTINEVVTPALAVASMLTPEPTPTQEPTRMPAETPTPPSTNTPEPTKIPDATPTRDTFESIDSLVNEVLGSRLQSSAFDFFSGPSGRIGYDVDLTISSPNDRTRAEMLSMAYNLAHEFYYNFSDTKPHYLTLHLRAPDDISCVFGLGIGYAAVVEYLPSRPPDDLETWFGALVASRNYADLPGQSDEFMAYGNDPTSKPFCKIDKWKK